MNSILEIINANRKGLKKGIYAVCSAQPLVIEAAIHQAIKDDSLLLIEATANQVNQFGGYTGMTPKDFIGFVEKIASQLNFPMSRIILGGDHLGPVCWVNETAKQAMNKAEELIKSYVKAGFVKIHLDTSMPCADDPLELADIIVAQRAAQLCKVAENAAKAVHGKSNIIYIIGTEVPPPGGSTEEINSLEVTPVARVEQTLELHKTAFEECELSLAWQRVIGLVVQPGVEFDHTSIIEYQSDKAQQLSQYVTSIPNIVFEAHSTDYQMADAYNKLIEDHFAILKVGPQLTFAMREALFALAHIEDELIDIKARSNLRQVIEKEMLANDQYWKKFYQDSGNHSVLYRRYSYSDRLRYYWNTDIVEDAVVKLFNNLNSVDIPLPLISQYLPEQYLAIRQEKICAKAKALVIDKIMQVTDMYSSACNKQVSE